jgi:hypothetical protein
MISPADHELGIRQRLVHNRKRLDHQLEPFVRSPLSEGQNAVLWIAAAGKVGILRAARQNSMRSQMHVGSAIFFVENLPIARHEHRNRIREQKHPRGQRSSHPVEARVPHASVLQIDCVHQMMQGNVRVAAAQAREQRSKQSQEGI